MKEGMNQFRDVYTTPNPAMKLIATRHGKTNLDSSWCNKNVRMDAI